MMLKNLIYFLKLPISKSDKVFSWRETYNFLKDMKPRYITFGMIKEDEEYHFITILQNNPLKEHNRELDVMYKITNAKYIEVFW